MYNEANYYMKISLSVIYIYFNTPKEIADSINTLIKTVRKTSYEIIIVNNNSPKKLPTIKFKKIPHHIITNNRNLGFGKAVNQAEKISKGKYIFILNPDTKMLESSIDLMIERISSDTKIGAIGPQLINGQGKVLHSIASNPKIPDILFALSFINKAWPKNPYSKKYWAIDVDRSKEMETETIGGAAMMISKRIFEKVGGFDERFFLYFEEIDLCLRIKKLGYKIVYFPKAKIIHYVGRSTTDKKFINNHYEKSRFLFLEKYYGLLPAFLTESFLRSSSFIGKIF